ncbi:MAG: nucleotidyl transferase AbiEii/AbiGii toxin family protein [bacterium]
MSYRSLIEERLRESEYRSELEEENALKQIFQEIILYALYEARFFNIAAFHGGTELRILRNSNRFSEDLDFALYVKNKAFDFSLMTKQVKESLFNWEVEMEVIDKSKAGNVIKKMLLKDTSMAKLLILNPLYDKRKTVSVKVELDTHPPEGINTEIKYLEYPVTFPVTSFDLSTSFSGKLHALLCRNYIKGRDWYDFIWYTQKKPELNIKFIRNAFFQQGPWEKQNIEIDKEWIIEKLKQKINEIDWKQAKEDVRPFLKHDYVGGLEHWSKAYFQQALMRLYE